MEYKVGQIGEYRSGNDSARSLGRCEIIDIRDGLIFCKFTPNYANEGEGNICVFNEDGTGTSRQCRDKEWFLGDGRPFPDRVEDGTDLNSRLVITSLTAEAEAAEKIRKLVAELEEPVKYLQNQGFDVYIDVLTKNVDIRKETVL